LSAWLTHVTLVCLSAKRLAADAIDTHVSASQWPGEIALP
jgi:hypothetical protein